MANKWVRDTNGDRYCAWHLVPPGVPDEDADTQGIATVFPMWEGTARMSGRPSHFAAMVGYKVIGNFPTIRAATRAIDAAVSQ